jgi:hypothetical protein
MRGRTLFGVGAMLISAVCGCSGDDDAPGSAVGKSKGGSGGSGGTAGSLSLDCEALGGGCAGMGGAGGAAQGGASGGGGAANQAGTTSGGTGGSSTIGGSGTGGTKPAGTCKRASGSDADCADFYEDKPQAYTCDDAGAYVALNGAHASNCASVTFVTGSKYGACCPP